MRHGKKINALGRTASHRKAMLSNMACSLIEHKRIHTTVAKAKALRGFIEPLVTKSKVDSTHSRRVVFRNLQNKHAVNELFREVAPKVADRPGGYTRIIKVGNRLGDNAEMCYIELVDFNELMLQDKKDSKGKSKTRRSRRGKGGGSKASTTPKPEAKKEKKDNTPKAEAKKEEAPKADDKKEDKPKEEKKDDSKDEPKEE